MKCEQCHTFEAVSAGDMPVFPVEEGLPGYDWRHGLTIRDRIVIAVLPALIAKGYENVDVIVENAYKIADVMIGRKDKA